MVSIRLHLGTVGSIQIALVIQGGAAGPISIEIAKQEQAS
jgi:hypothetical protein